MKLHVTFITTKQVSANATVMWLNLCTNALFYWFKFIVNDAGWQLNQRIKWLLAMVSLSESSGEANSSQDRDPPDHIISIGNHMNASAFRDLWA